MTKEEGVSPACCLPIITIALLGIRSSWYSDEMWNIVIIFLSADAPKYLTLS